MRKTFIIKIEIISSPGFRDTYDVICIKNIFKFIRLLFIVPFCDQALDINQCKLYMCKIAVYICIRNTVLSALVF